MLGGLLGLFIFSLSFYGNNCQKAEITPRILDLKFLDSALPCNCDLKKLSCNCCNGIIVDSLAPNRDVCIEFVFKIFPPSVTISMEVDDKRIASFVLDPTVKVGSCQPIFLPGVPLVSLCIKLHDFKLDGLNIQVCSTFHVGLTVVHIVHVYLPCVKMGINGLQIKGVPKTDNS